LQDPTTITNISIIEIKKKGVERKYGVHEEIPINL